MLILLYVLSVLLMILAPVILAALHRRRFPVPWLLFCAGILTFAASQAVHFPLNHWLAEWGIMAKAGREINPPLWQTALIAGLTAGLCEELARVAGYAVLRRYRSLGDGIMLALGHGGIESMVFGGVMVAATVSAMLPLVGTDLKALSLSTEQLAALEKQLHFFIDSPWLAFAPLLERLLAMGFHVVLSVMVLQAFLHRNILQRVGYILLVIFYHMIADAGAVYLVQEVASPWLLEGAFALVLLPGFAWLAAMVWRQKGPPRPVVSLAREWKVFWVALRKELLQQWRTRRVLVVLAVFGLFGMTSPLMAYYMPQMFRLIPGAEQFAGLIPKPTIADALGQYIKNISQFGFLLAVLLGMNAVAGEKEHGTAALILSKPMSRWAFLLSKFTSQAIVYLLGFLLAMPATGFYTYVLFGSLDFAGLGLITLLLAAWLLPFAAVTLLGSVIGGTTSAAAGIALGGAVALFLMGNLPVVGSFLPAALAGWAGQIGAGTPPQAWNGGALAASLVLCLVCMILSIAIFERQEL